jgi:hypothetical protein
MKKQAQDKGTAEAARVLFDQAVRIGRCSLETAYDAFAAAERIRREYQLPSRLLTDVCKVDRVKP